MDCSISREMCHLYKNVGVRKQGRERTDYCIMQQIWYNIRIYHALYNRLHFLPVISTLTMHYFTIRNLRGALWHLVNARDYCYIIEKHVCVCVRLYRKLHYTRIYISSHIRHFSMNCRFYYNCVWNGIAVSCFIVNYCLFAPYKPVNQRSYMWVSVHVYYIYVAYNLSCIDRCSSKCFMFDPFRSHHFSFIIRDICDSLNCHTNIMYDPCLHIHIHFISFSSIIALYLFRSAVT